MKYKGSARVRILVWPTLVLAQLQQNWEGLSDESFAYGLNLRIVHLEPAHIKSGPGPELHFFFFYLRAEPNV